ncbi:MAG TPA: dihydrolipoamide acetyltransferase family protein [Spirochaetia bacterium]|nr:dihydrolipoamide acetyltransferase family protein [Spirochaetia bacterium]
MAEKVFMIALSPTMEEGTILNWKKKVGDVVKMDEPLCEVETDKASMEYLSSQEGTILAIVKEVGAGAKVGDVIAVIGTPGEDFASLVEAAPAAKPAAPASPAAPAAVSAPAAGPAAPAPVTAGGRVKSSPLARKLAADKGIDLGQVAGSGPAGRVVKSDVEHFQPAAKAAAPAAFAPSSPGASGLNDERVPVSKKRQTIARRLGESLFTAPHFFLTVGIEMDNLLEARDRINAKRKEKVGLNPFILKFLAEALKRHQALNSSWEGEFIQNHSSVDLGIAVAQPDGLITPIVKNAGAKGILQIEAELKDLIDRARAGQLKPEEFTGATFTISNLGSFGIEEFTAIINPPGVAILALGATVKTPVVAEDDSIVVKRIMKVTLSCDHRVVDGAVGAGFLTEFKRMVEDPYTVLL